LVFFFKFLETGNKLFLTNAKIRLGCLGFLLLYILYSLKECYKTCGRQLNLCGTLQIDMFKKKEGKALNKIPIVKLKLEINVLIINILMLTFAFMF
jgi:hypothetical protein